MNNLNSLKNKSVNQGFTLIELIIVIIILGILSVTVAPKFFTAKGFSAYGYRTDVIAKLRLIQLKAMQQTQAAPDPENENRCHTVLLTDKKLGTPDNCVDELSFNSTWQDSTTKVKIADQDDVIFSGENITDNSFSFDSMGRPSSSCNAPCKITINGEQNISVQIESEGYIHAL
ncbi:prepilin-type N-terminal cleavage/methylation domain-containing protein [Colwellia sp. MB02u-9]|uniref:prepilin-type N-terminal cleavage/methylation domain-containing protein n=1 Tax=Colwellia sp. MB02u-9 TaxID=2759823 RepID=UPI0015F5E9D6|nr:prepilin-type N-terminal cleavage/methylation domain-containing protein [Colwellia sp. MB02u-9]MBA6297630.1 prepilin-type N-terminal cleavage/methylation domain-containing protein [Colwellia sp. MB02u-9]